MKNTLENKVAIVTGAGSGIGEGIALRFLASRARVVAVDLYEDRLSSLKQEAKSRRLDESNMKEIVGDVTSIKFVGEFAREIADSFGQIDILVNTVGGSLGLSGKEFIDTELSHWDLLIKLNLYSMFCCTKIILPYMIRRKYGKVLNFGSSVATGDSGSGGETQAVYATCKAGIMMFTKAVAREVASYGINVNCVTPGLVKSRVTERFPKEVLDSVVRKTPFGRIGEPEDIANVALFLVSDQSAWLTGQNICAGGGLVMH